MRYNFYEIKEKKDCDLFLLWARQNMRGDK